MKLENCLSKKADKIFEKSQRAKRITIKVAKDQEKYWKRA